MTRQRASRIRGAESGVTLMELLIAITLLSLLSVGILISLRVALSAMNKTDTRLTSDRRVNSVQRIIEEQIEGLIPVTADCQPAAQGPRQTISFFQGETQSMRFVSTYSLQQGARGLPMILEFQVIPGEDSEGVRLVVNERLYTGPRGAGQFCPGIRARPGHRNTRSAIRAHSDRRRIFRPGRQTGFLHLQLSRHSAAPGLIQMDRRAGSSRCCPAPSVSTWRPCIRMPASWCQSR